MQFQGPSCGRRRWESLPSYRPLLKKWSTRIDNWAHSDSLSGIYARILEYSPTLLLWIYNKSTNDYQRAAVGFDSENQLVVSKVFVPEKNDAEINLNFVLNKKFRKISIKELPPKMCLDYMPAESTYFNLESGVSIVYSLRTKTVESISWTSPLELKKQTSHMQACEKRDYEMIEAP